MEIEIIPNIHTFSGGIPTGTDLVVFEKENPPSESHPMLVLYGFDEIGLFDSSFKNPVYGFCKIESQNGK